MSNKHPENEKRPAAATVGVELNQTSPVKGNSSMKDIKPYTANMQPQTMSSREIAELTGKRHDHVMVDCRKLAQFYTETYSPEISGEHVRPSFYKDSTGRDLPCFALSKQASLDLVTGYSLPHRHAVNVRWQELEQQVATIDPMKMLADPAAMRTLLLGYTEKVIELEHKVEEMQPDVDAFQRIAKADGSVCLTDAAKIVQMRPKDFIALLNQEHWIYKRRGSSHYVGYQDKVQAGYLEHKVTEVTRSDGSTKITEQVRVLPKGLTRISKIAGDKGKSA